MPDPLHPRTPMSLGGLSLRQVAVEMWTRMEEHDAMTWAAAAAFYAMFATVPFLAILLGVVVLRLPDLSGAGHRTTGLGNLTVDQLDATLRSLFPNEAYVLVRNQIAHIQGEPPLALLSLGVAIALWSASNLFLVVIDALNRTYGVKETRSFVKLRLTAMTMTLLQASCLIGSLVAIVAWPQILRVLGLDPNGVGAWVATAVRWSAGEPDGNHRLSRVLHPVPPLRPELRQLQPVVGSARSGHGAVVLVLGRGLGALGRGRNG
jgi:membrane protein